MTRVDCARAIQERTHGKAVAVVEASISNGTPLPMTLSDVRFETEPGFTSRLLTDQRPAVDPVDDVLDPSSRQLRYTFLKSQECCNHVFFVDLAMDDDVVRLMHTHVNVGRLWFTCVGRLFVRACGLTSSCAHGCECVCLALALCTSPMRPVWLNRSQNSGRRMQRSTWVVSLQPFDYK